MSPSKGALLIIPKLAIVTLALGKLFSKLKSTSAKATVASTFSLIDWSTIALILSLNKNGAAANAIIVTNRKIPNPFKIFLTIRSEFF